MELEELVLKLLWKKIYTNSARKTPEKKRKLCGKTLHTGSSSILQSRLWNGIERPERNTCIYENLIYHKDDRSIHRDEDGVCVCVWQFCALPHVFHAHAHLPPQSLYSPPTPLPPNPNP